MDTCGLGYKIVTQKMGLFGPPELLDALTTEKVIEQLFPVHLSRRVRTYDVPVHAIPLFTEEELIVATKILKRDGLPDPMASRLRYCRLSPFGALPCCYKCITRA